ncbi:cytochrome P450 [Mycena latifolia]|nr:cytochrome P450 [Mycena latifolia]
MGSNLLTSLSVLCALAIAYWLLTHLRRGTVRLRGPPSPSFLFGHTAQVKRAPRPADLYSSWAQTYGGVYQVRGPLGAARIVLCDPKALAHMLALDSWKYCHPPLARRQLSSLTGPASLLVVLGDVHNSERSSTQVFGPAALKTYSPIMYDSVYKARPVFAAWESQLQSSATNEIIADVSEWVNNVSFDVIGLAAFAHDFKSLDGATSRVASALTALGHSKPSPTAAKILLLSQAYPILLKLPLPRSAQVAELSSAMDAVVDGLTSAHDGHDGPASALGVLLNAKELSPAQVRVHWALVELSMKPEKQERLRAELSAFSTNDISYDELTSLGLPYLDAIVSETLRLHPILEESARALEDDILPLAEPVRTASGALIDRLPIRKGTVLTMSLLYTNLSKTIWGPDAPEFKPERWLNDSEGVPASAKAYPGYHHTMSFLDGPRTCLGKGFALAEIKIVLSVFIRKFVFCPRDGMDTKYDKAGFGGPHPKVAGEPGGRLPMRIRRVE